ncbi:alpha/beta hydrolase [Leptospira tipperaryensis]|uniref:Alpha/beta hydrolase n=1 Tax=Leptospira tipperaryensis TaxID=2564040 RepID=A0A1D7V379_9LEPT|nr:alpha/beta hydrolase [Leptospira tipperaryensis]AOP36292.1 alpha/beta hydrolase [Leptospira tipperaryensis]
MRILKYLTFVIAIVSILQCTSRSASVLKENTTTEESIPTEKGHAPIGDIQLYYEIHGEKEGVPLVLLNGGGSTIEVTFSKAIPYFAKHRKVIALDEQGHGRTTDRKGPVRFETSADDVAALLKHLKIEKADFFGFSNGASVALQVSIRHPHLVRKLVFASSMTKRTGAYPQFWDFMKKATFSNMPQPLKDAFLKVNPDPQKLRTMFEKDLERMQNFKDVSDKEIGTVKAPTLILSGDRDIAKLEHTIELTRKIPDARLLILPGGHGDYLGEAIMYQKETHYPELTAALIEEFLGPPQL